MSGTIQKHDIITPEALKVFSEIVAEFNKILEAAKKLKIETKDGGGLKDTENAAKKAKENISQLEFQASELTKQMKKLGEERAKTATAASRQNKEIIKEQVARKKVTDAIKEEITGAKAAAKQKIANAKAAKKAKENISQLEFQVSELTKQMKKLGEERAKTATAGSRQNKEIVKEQVARKKVTDAIKEEITGAKAAAKQKITNAKAARDAATALKDQDRATKLLIAAQKAQKGTVAQLNKVNAVLKNKIKGLNTAIPKERQQVQRLTTAIERNNQKKKTLTKTNSGLMSSFKKMAKAALAYMMVYVGLTQVVRFFTTTLFNLTKKLDSLKFSMRTIIKDSEELAATNIFLAKTAVNYGLDILTLTERYIKFRAASQQSNMSARETMKIFNSTAKAAAVLGLKTDEVNGVFLALEQMISKGKVTTEELRRQLGERLPGAMGIMADAMGVSISELDKMLKKGEVLSSEALPKFADALEKAYGVESLEKVDNLAAAHGRMNTAWVQFVDSLQASTAYIAVLNAATNFIKAMSPMPSLDELAGADTEARLSKINKIMSSIETEEGKIAFTKQAAVKLELQAIKVGEKLVKQKETLTTLSKTPFISPAQINQATDELAKTEAVMLSMLNTAKALREGTEGGNGFEPFNLDTYIANLNSAKKGTASFANSSSDALKGFITKTTPLMTEQLNTYKGILLAERESLISKRLLANTETDRTQKLADENKNTKNWIGLSKDASAAALKLSNIKQGQVEVDNRLAELNKKGRGAGAKDKDITPPQTVLNSSLDSYKAYYESRLSQARGNAEETIAIEREMILNQLQDQDELNALTLLERQKLLTKLQDLDDDFFQIQSDKAVASIFEQADMERVAVSKKYTEELAAANNRASRRKAIEIKLAIELLSIENAAQQAIRDDINTTEDERVKAAAKQLQLQEQLNKIVRKGTVETERLKREELERTLSFIGQQGNAAFNVQQQFSDAQLQRAKNRYDREVQLAGDSEAAKLVAKRKFEKEERKIAKRQAKADKANAIFNILLNTAVAITAAAIKPWMIPIVAAIGAAQLAAVAAQPLPFFAEGVKNFEGGQAIVGDKKGDPTKAGGAELGILPSGQMFMTPSTPTVMNLPAGTDIIPNDMVASTLANEAMTSTYNMIDMSSTNSQLRQINKNTSESTTYEGGYKIVRRKNFVGRYKV